MAVRITSNTQSYTRTLSLGSTTQFAVCGWFKISSDRNGYTTLWEFDDNDGGDSYYMLGTDDDGTTVGLLAASTSDRNLTGGNLTPGVWYYIAAAINGSAGVALVRSATASSFSATTWASGGPSSTSISILRIGQSHYNTTEYLNGCVAALKVYADVSLSREELENEAWTTLPQRTNGLIGWYPFTRAETVDYSGNGNTLSGGSGASTEDGPPIAWRRGRTTPMQVLATSAEAEPGLLAAPWTLPDPTLSLDISTGVDLLTAPWSVPTPDVSTTGAPPLLVPADPILVPWSVPTPSTSVDVTVFASPIAALWSLPAPEVVVPVNPGDDITGPAQVSFGGFKMGDGTPYLWQRMTGHLVDMPRVDNGNVPNPSSHGAMSGRKLAQARTVSMDIKVAANLDNIDQVALDFLAGLPLPDADEEIDLAISVGGMILVGRGACVDRRLPLDRTLHDGYIPGQVQWELSDPRLYMRGLNSATIPDGSGVEVFNAGNTNTKPRIRCDGPAETPRFEVVRTLADGTEDTRVIEFNITLDEGERLVVDVALGTATIGEDSQMRWLTGASIGVPDFVLGRGTSEIFYETQSGSAPSAVVLWQHALL